MSTYFVVEVETPSDATRTIPAAAVQDWSLPHHCTVSALPRAGCVTYTLVLPADDADQAARAGLVIAGDNPRRRRPDRRPSLSSTPAAR